MSGDWVPENIRCASYWLFSRTGSYLEVIVQTTFLLTTTLRNEVDFVELFFCKKIPLSRRVGYVMGG